MNEEYLWSRTGTDSEIEDLERKLAPFRLKSTDAPRATPALDPPSRRRFGLRLAFAGLSFASVIVAAFVYLFVGSAFSDTRSLSVTVSESPSRIEAIEVPEAPALVKPREFQATVAKQRKPERRTTAPADPKPGLRSSDRPAEDQLAALTAEEREAYDKLMLALSVTTSSLRLVQEKADGSDLAYEGPADAELPERSN